MRGCKGEGFMNIKRLHEGEVQSTFVQFMLKRSGTNFFSLGKFTKIKQ